MVSGKRIILNTFGSFGDIHPYMAIAIELQNRGHHPVIATSELYREKIECAGLSFTPVRPNLPPPAQQDQQLMDKIMEPRTGPKFLLEEIIFSSLRDSYQDLFNAASDADLLITHPAAPAGPFVARKTSVPWISTVLAPLSFFSAYDPPVPPYWSWLSKVNVFGPVVTGYLLNLMKRGYRPEAIESLRQELKLADFGNSLFEGQHSPQCVLALFSSSFAKPQPDWPTQTEITGFCFYDGHRELEMPNELKQFLADGPAPIVFTLGSSAVWVAQDFFQQSIRAATLLNKRAVLLIGDERNLPPDPLPPNVIAVNYAPYQSLLPQAIAMVHHGGVGTTSQGLRAGVPTLIVPFAFDQPDNAARAAKLGTSRTISRKRYQARSAARELDLLLTRTQYAAAAKAMSQQLKSENGTAKACDAIERIVHSVPNQKKPAMEPALCF